MAEPAVVGLVDRHAAGRDRISRTVQARVGRLWRQFHGHYSDPAVAQFAAAAAQLVRSGQFQTANLTQAYLLRVLTEMGRPPRRPPGLQLPRDLRTGVSVDAEFERIVAYYRYLQSQGVPPVEAGQRSERRAVLVAETDLSLAMREASRQTLTGVPAVTGWRRVIHPEQSAGGTCGLCVVAADRIYHVAELLPLHARCHCTTLPIVGKDDPGHKLNTADLKAIYAAAGSTAAEDLKRTRYTVHHHGELGPVLGRAGDHWRGPADVDADTGTH